MKIENISKSFGEKKVLCGFSAHFEDGKITALMGTSGKGKTTLLRIIAGLEKADGGEVRKDGARVAYLFQEDRLIESLSAFDNIRLVSHASDEQIKAMLFQMDLDADIFGKVADFSGGMKRRVSIARALLFDAPLVLLDEPFRGLDEQTKAKVAAVMQKSLAQKTAILVTHSSEEAALLGASEIIQM